jgi:hypothetical protein
MLDKDPEKMRDTIETIRYCAAIWIIFLCCRLMDMMQLTELFGIMIIIVTKMIQKTLIYGVLCV